MIVLFERGPLDGRELDTDDATWSGGWFTTGAADWTLYIPRYQDPATGIVTARARLTIPRRQ